jgi:hypothetical protein
MFSSGVLPVVRTTFISISSGLPEVEVAAAGV